MCTVEVACITKYAGERFLTGKYMTGKILDGEVFDR
jgi:hypothetical protein